MTLEQWIIRLALVIPSLVLTLLYLPYHGGGYQFLGIIDLDFLMSGTLDYMRLIVQVVALGIVWLLLELYARRTLDMFPVRDERGYLKQRR